MTANITTRPLFLTANTMVHTAWDFRNAAEQPAGEGVADYESFRVIERQAGANMSVDIGTSGVGLMRAWVRGDTREGQGLYQVDNIDRSAPTANTFNAQLNDAITGNASGNPRLDQVILEVLDSQHTGASNLARIRVVAGTPSGGATLENRTGAAALPSSAIPLADVIVANGAATIVAANIRDRRPFPLLGVVPPLLTDVDMVAFMPHPLMPAAMGQYSHDTMDMMQAAALMYLPRRIVGATRIRWKYRHMGTANTGAFIIGIYDASGRFITSTTGVPLFAGAANSYQVVSGVINPTPVTFDAGWYYVAVGFDTATAGGVSNYNGVHPALSVGSHITPAPNLAVRSASGGVTFPFSLLSMTDVCGITADTVVPPVPLIALSVG